MPRLRSRVRDSSAAPVSRGKSEHRFPPFRIESRGSLGPSSRARWQSGYAADCKSAYLGSIPGRASKLHRSSGEIRARGSRGEPIAGHYVLVILTYRYRLLPTRRQHRALECVLEGQRQLYNAALEERIDAYRKAGVTRSYYDQTKALAELRADDAEFRAVPASVQRATLKRLDDAYRAFFRRSARGDKPGFPRFRGKGWFDTFGFREFCGITLKRNRLRFKGMPGGLRVHMHRPLPEAPDIRSCSFHRSAKGWLVSLNIRQTAGVLRKRSRVVGIDLGLDTFAVLSDGGFIPALRAARRAERRLRVRQRALQRKKAGSDSRLKARAELAREHAAVARRRHEFLHQSSARLIRDYDVIAIEALDITPLLRTGRARSLMDASWMKFISLLRYKAEKAGARIIEVDAQETTQDCSQCGARVFKKLSERWHECACGASMDRDLNAARNILNRAGVGPSLLNVAV